MKLVAITIKQAKPLDKDYKLSDGKGLHLLVKKNGGKYWRQAYRFAGKQKTLALGVYPKVSLAEARERSTEAHKQLRNGIDPNEAKRTQKIRDVEAGANTFGDIAEEWYAIQLPHWAEKTSKKRRALLDKDIIPYIGKRPIKEIDAIELITCLKRIEKRGAIDTAYTGRQVLTQICRHAVQTQKLKSESDPAPYLQGILSKKITVHRPAIISPAEFGLLLVKISKYSGTHVIRTMFQLAPLLFQRPGELAAMEWQEIDFDEQLWNIPKEKKKERNNREDDHIVPLSEQAIKLLKDIEPLTGNGKYVFPGINKAGTHANEASINKALRTIGYCTKTEQSFHGFRASATTMLNERLHFRVDYIEQQMGHGVKDALGRAYNRTKHLEERTAMMQRWSDYLDELKHQIESGKVITGSFGNNQKIKDVKVSQA